MHILLLAPSSSGKTTLSQFFKKIGYSYIGCDDFMNKVSKKTEMKYYPKDEISVRDFVEPMFDEYMKQSSNDILCDYVSYDLASFFEKNNAKVFTVILYPTVRRVLNNMYQRRTVEKRQWKTVFGGYKNLFKIAEEGDEVIDIIDKNELIGLLKEKLKFLFRSEEDIHQKVDEFFTSLGASDLNQDKFPISLKTGAKYDMFIKIENQTPIEIFKSIQSRIHPIPPSFTHKHILFTGPTCSGKSYISGNFKRMGFDVIDYCSFRHKVDPNIDFNQYIKSYDDEDLIQFRIPMFNEGRDLDRVIYEDRDLTLISLYGNRPLFTVFFHISPYKLIHNMSKIIYKSFRHPEEMYTFTYFYTVDEDGDNFKTVIHYNSFRNLLKEKLQFLFYSEEDLDEVLQTIFNDLNITNIDKEKIYKLKIRDNIKFDLLLDTENKTAEEMCDFILSH